MQIQTLILWESELTSNSLLNARYFAKRKPNLIETFMCSKLGCLLCSLDNPCEYRENFVTPLVRQNFARVLLDGEGWCLDQGHYE